MIRPLTAGNLDSFFAIVPLANSYHALADTQARRLEIDAKNYAGLLNLMRFMAIGRGTGCVTFEYSANDVFHNHTNIVECPFLLDGDSVGCKLNDTIPRLGVVPAIADWLLTIIKDDLTGTNHIASGDSVNWPNYTGSNPLNSFASFGISSVRYSWKEVLETFQYRFAWAVFNEMLQTGGPLGGEGQKRAQMVLGRSPFGRAVESGRVDLGLKNWKALRDVLGTHGQRQNKNRPLAVHEPPIEVVKLKSFFIFTRGDDEVIRDGNDFRNATVTRVSNWVKHQHDVIVADFQSDLEEVILDLFMEKVADAAGQEHLRPRMLKNTHRNSITVARDFLEYFRNKIEGLSLYIQTEFDRQFYPSGSTQPSLISLLQTKVQEKIRVMQASPGDHTSEQEDYLRALGELLEAEVWQILVEALQRTVVDVQAVVEGLWETIGYSAEGWCFTLEEAREACAKAYSRDQSRRIEWTQMRLRTYLPFPGQEAEDILFGEVSDPYLTTFFEQASWHIAINSAEKGVSRYELVLEYPGLEKRMREVVRMRTLSGQQIEVARFTHTHLVSWAKEQLRSPLEKKTIWDIMELDFSEDWLRKKGKKVEALTGQERASLETEYVRERINSLINQSGPLWTLSGGHFQTKQQWGTWGSFVISATPGNIAERFCAELQNRQEPLRQADDLRHEIRRSAGYFCAPITAWSYHSTCYGNYLAYLQNPTGIIVDIYVHEQNAHRLRHWILSHVDPSMTELLDITVVGLLNDLELFRLFALAYTMDIIPRKTPTSATATTTEIYCLGPTDLPSVLDIDSLSVRILDAYYKDQHGVWHRNDSVQQCLRQVWNEYENKNMDPGKVNGWLDTLETRAGALTFPNVPGQRAVIHRDHLKKAFQAVVREYIRQVKTAKGLP
jgi:hypothetical protein